MLLDILLGVIILVCAALVGVILLQRSEGGVLGMSGGSGGFMTARGTGDLLTTTTQILAGLFFALCLLMTVLSGREHAASSVADKLKLSINPNAISSQPAASSAAPAAPAPIAPAPQTAPASLSNPLNLFGSDTGPAPAAHPAATAPKTATKAKPATKTSPKPAKPATVAAAPAPAPAISAPAPVTPPPATAPAAPAGQ